jgi:nitrate reductase assembly molybdenum cofactor insertion protein NarJ
MTEAVLEAFSDLLRYPGEGRAEKLPGWIEEIQTAAPSVDSDLQALSEYWSTHNETELEETFVRTFENNAERALELGRHLHGENYARGSFMARMRGLLRQLGIKESVELPDHVSHLLSVVSRAEPALARALARTVVVPALTKIEEGFGEKQNPYYGVIVGLHHYIDEHYADEAAPQQQDPTR